MSHLTPAGAEWRKRVEELNRTASAYPRDATIHALFADRAAERPGAVAIEDELGAVTYAELDARANRIAHHLRGMGVAEGVLVGLALSRSPDQVAGILGILKAGGAYVPLDPEHPAARLRFMLEDTAAAVVLTERGVADRLPAASSARMVLLDRDATLIARHPATPPAPAGTALSPAYVMYTSGSTGRPKGVVVPHRAVVRLVRGNHFMRFGEDEVFLLLAPISFDASTLELWGALLNGSKLALAPDGIAGIEALGRLIRHHGVTTLWLTAALFREVVDTDLEALRPLRQLLAGGDVLPVVQVRRVLAELPRLRLINGYGPTENTTFTCCHTIQATDASSGEVPIGRPIANSTAYVLDEAMDLVPPGSPGELYAGGDGLALGYLNQADLTAARFLASPFGTGERLYRTGDRARWRADGVLEFLGRLDTQIKLRGYRIELGEIEAVMARHPGVSGAVAALREDEPGVKRLVGYYIADDAAPLRGLWERLEARLPEYMIPAALVRVEAFPLGSTGKVDRAALPGIPEYRPVSEISILPVPEAGTTRADGPAGRSPAPFAAPADELERRIAAVFQETLRSGPVGRWDDFLALGGDSLLAVRVAARLRQNFGVELSFSAILEHRTPASLVRMVERRTTGATAQPHHGPIPAARRGEHLRRRRSVPRERTLAELLTEAPPEPIALESVDRAPLTYGGWARQALAAAAWLREAGMGPKDAAAIVIPNGPELASAFLGTALAGVSAPLNPAYRREEFEFYLDDLGARMLLIAEGLDSPAREVARERGIRIVEVGLPEGAPSGIFSLDGRVPTGTASNSPGAGDIALVLHTSGTTSRPKMVPLTHGNLLASSAAVAETLRLSKEDRCLNVMPLFHIHGLVAAVLGSLTAGGSVVCTPGFFAPRFFPWLEQCDPTWYTAVPTMHQAVLSRASGTANQTILRSSRLRFARSSSAAMPRRVLDELEKALGVPLIEAYGMTEAAHQMASNPLPPGERKPGSVGRSAGAELGIMDAAGGLLAPGQTGEVVIRGPGVTAGYRTNPDANARAFSGGWLRTGDEGALDAEGYLTLTGRLKEQINRAGEKISPLEVDRVLSEHPAVAQALCFGVAHPVLGEDIAAAVVLRPDARVAERELRDYVAGRLAYFKTPRRVVFVDAIPTGPTGKLQRLGLAERLGVKAEVPVDDLDLTPPRTPVEEIVAAAWADVMERPAPGVRRNFFALGGDSILATRLAARLRDLLAVELPLLALFDAPSVEGIAQAVEGLLGEESAGPPAAIPNRADPGRAPATPEQRLLWEIEREASGTAPYHLPILRRIAGPLNLDLLAAALQDLAARHEAFRTSFSEGPDGLSQRIAPSVRLPLEVLDFRHLPLPEAEAIARQALRERVARPFDLTVPPLCRATVARLADRDTLLLLTVHHLVSDGWSLPLIANGISEAYAARAEGREPWPGPATPDFGDYAAWLAAPERRRRRTDHLEYWRTLLEGADLSADLPTDHPRPTHPTFEGHSEHVLVPRELLTRLEDRARANDTTLYVVLLATFRILLYRLGGQEDLTFGTVLAGRDTVDVERMIGYFARTVLIRTRVTESTTLAELMRESRTRIIDALDHPASLEEVVGAVRTPSGWAFRLLFFFNEEQTASDRLGDAWMRPVSMGIPGTKADLSLALTRRSDGLDVVLNARTALYEPETARRFLHLYQTLLGAVAEGGEAPVSRYALLQEGEREQVLALAAGAELSTRVTRTLGELFLEQASRSRDRTAIIAEGGNWTFGMLAERAGHLAADLARRGIGPGDIVAVVSGRIPEMVMATVAVTLSGAAYLPLDSDQPPARIRGMIEDSGARLVLADTQGEVIAGDRVPVQRFDASRAPSAPAESPSRRPGPEDPVYVIFTSGSTGRPKGVVVPHRALVNYLDWMLHEIPIGGSDVVLQGTPMGFDASVWEIWGPLLAGCPMVLARRDRDAFPRYLGETIRANGVTLIQLVPSMLGLVLELDGLLGCDTVTRVISGGEALPADLARRFHAAHGAELLNLYGPTETTIYATCWRSRPGFGETTVPIGRPIPNLRAYVLDAHREPMPIGIPGELYLGGTGVALGYLGRPDLTEERFVPDPFGAGAGDRMYRTGDRARFKADGNLEYLGRLDDQVKLHGVRIEPGEVESLLNARPDVLESAVGVVTEGMAGARLVAWVVPHPGAAPGGDVIREELARRLPRSCVPSAVRFVDQLPRTPGGKIDRRALPTPRNEPVPYEPPGTPTEQRVAEAWARVLGRERIGRHDDLFALGGHSLLAIRVAHRLRGQDGADLTLRTILEHPTVAMLAAELDRIGSAASSPAETGIQKVARAARVARPGSSRPPPQVS